MNVSRPTPREATAGAAVEHVERRADEVSSPVLPMSCRSRSEDTALR
jgi:hypothetical protein